MATKLLRSGYDPEADKGAWHMYGSGLGMAYFCATIWLYFYPALWVYKKGQSWEQDDITDRPHFVLG